MITLTAPQSKIFKDKSRFLQSVCGRRFGKTYVGTAKIAYEALTNKNQNLLYVAPSFAMADRVFSKFFLQMVSAKYILQHHKSKHYFHLKNGTYVYYMGASNYDALRGDGRHGVILDESADIPFEAVQESILPSLSDKEGWLWALGTPEGQANWFFDITLQDDWKTYQFTTLDGGNVRPEEIERMRAKMDARTFRQEYLASFEDITSKVYYCYSDENIRNDIEFNPNKETYLCWDFNYNPMSCILVQKENNVYYAVKEFIHNKSNTYATAESVDEWLRQRQFNATLYITGDSAGSRHESTASRTDWQIIEGIFKSFRGFKGVFVRRTKKIRDRVNHLNALFNNTLNEKRLFVNKDECPQLHNDLMRVQWRSNSMELDDQNGKLTHASDALSYLAYNFESMEEKAITRL